MIIMTNTREFLVCHICGNLIGFIHDVGVPMICCGKPMETLIPNTVDASQEKHVPVAVRDGNTLHVTVGSAPHPMLPEHYIMWIAVADGTRTTRVQLAPGDAPEAHFVVSNGPLTVYKYCNLHGLWAVDV